MAGNLLAGAAWTANRLKQIHFALKLNFCRPDESQPFKGSALRRLSSLSESVNDVHQPHRLE